ncbi:LuxR C-terminal-related transcriptional regulator [Nitratidesulfovibrio sp. HK-II]|uniref:LuxR C-terminal-related transcriptional regulator n=1 Tax=Nitratidesulfovibrio sp. HK-II TaxID=2009266 RepID=UPI000E2EC734|nr:transcriptional regulator [Nitratidesulfovibrio sp. HK-II]
MHSTTRKSPSTSRHIAPATPGHVVDAWKDLILFTDARGIIMEVRGHPIACAGSTPRPGQSFWKALGLGGRSTDDALRRYPPLSIHEIHRAGRTFLLRIMPLPPAIAPRGGLVVVATDNHSMHALYRRYEQRLHDHISAWADSVTLFNALFDTAKDATFLMNEAGVIIAANPAALRRHAGDTPTGPAGPDGPAPTRPAGSARPDETDGAEFAGTAVDALLARRARPMVRKAMRALRPNGQWTRTLAARDAEGATFPAEATLRRIAFQGGSLFQLILHDLSERVELQDSLRDRMAEVKEMNIALRQVLRSVEEERQEMLRTLHTRMKRRMLPALDKIARAETAEVREGYRNLLAEQLAGMVGEPDGSNGPGGADGGNDPALLGLTPRELEVCRLIQLGRSGKEIADLLGISFETAQTHRKNIRKKLGLRGSTTSLQTHLQQGPSLL